VHPCSPQESHQTYFANGKHHNRDRLRREYNLQKKLKNKTIDSDCKHKKKLKLIKKKENKINKFNI